MNLKEYIELSGISVSDLAEKIGLDKSTISKYKTGDRIPSLKTAIKIEKETLGQVTVKDWAEND